MNLEKKLFIIKSLNQFNFLILYQKFNFFYYFIIIFIDFKNFKLFLFYFLKK